DADFRGALLDGTRFGGADLADSQFDGDTSPHTARAEAPTLDASLEDSLDALTATLRARGVAGGELLGSLREAIASLQTSSEPPEAWKPLLEPLMKLQAEGRPFDPQTLADVLAKL